MSILTGALWNNYQNRQFSECVLIVAINLVRAERRTASLLPVITANETSNSQICIKSNNTVAKNNLKLFPKIFSRLHADRLKILGCPRKIHMSTLAS